MKKKSKLLKNFFRMYDEARLNVSAAALAYNITLTFFPLLICLYTMMGNRVELLERVVEFAGKFLAPDSVELLQNFLSYIAENNSTAMMAAGLFVLVTSSSAGFRNLQATIGGMQGGTRYKGIWYFVSSIVLSLMFLATIYFAILVMFTGKSFISAINQYIPFIDIRDSWNSLRFVVLGTLTFFTVWGIFEISKRECDTYSTFIGSLLTTVALVAACLIFSFFFGKSANYSLVYGSLASIILLMLWLSYCCTAVCAGAAFNIALRDTKAEEKKAYIEEVRQKQEKDSTENNHIRVLNKR